MDATLKIALTRKIPAFHLSGDTTRWRSQELAPDKKDLKLNLKFMTQ